MAVLSEAISVVIRTEAIFAHYEGRWERFRDDCPNRTLCADGDLIRVGFMTPQDTQQFVEGLARLGIEYLRNGRAVDLVVADQQPGFSVPCDWAEFGRFDWGGNPSEQVAPCRSKDSDLNRVVTPSGWKYIGSLSAKFQFIDTDLKPESMDFLRHENGLDVCRDSKTGRKVFIGRTSTESSERVTSPRFQGLRNGCNPSDRELSALLLCLGAVRASSDEARATRARGKALFGNIERKKYD